MKLSFVLILVMTTVLFSQEEFQQELYWPPYEIEGWQPFVPWTGGYEYSTPVLVDIDADDDLDLFMGHWMKIAFYENEGSSNEPLFDLVSNYFDSITFDYQYGYYGRPVFADIDNDDDKDMIIWTGTFNELLYLNIGTSSDYLFEYQTDSFLETTTYGGGRGDFIDIDSDGDLDIFEGNYLGQILFYENTGDAYSYIYSDSPLILSGIDVGDKAIVSMCDIDADNDYDLFIGNHNGDLYFYRNEGDSINYEFIYVTDNFAGASVYETNAPHFCDIDGDGDFDLFLGMKWARYPYPPGNISFYENIGNSTEYEFIHITDNYLCFDNGMSYSPILLDVDNDGDLDMVGGSSDQKMPFIENTGTNQEPYFEWKEILWGGSGGFLGGDLAVGDLDSDGDLDKIVSTSDFISYYLISYKNIGTPDSASFIVWQYQFISSTEDWLNPALVDIDNDNDFDLLIETDINWDSNLLWYENLGDSLRPNFSSTPESILIFEETVHNMFFLDYDEDGDYDMFCSGVVGVQYFENIGSVTNPNFTLVTNNFGGIDYWVTNVTLGDIDNDSDYDMFVSLQPGGMHFYRNQSNPSPPVLSITLSYPDVILNWNSIAGAAEYKIYYQDTPYFTPSGSAQATVNPPDTSWIDIGAVNLGKRFYRVVAGN